MQSRGHADSGREGLRAYTLSLPVVATRWLAVVVALPWMQRLRLELTKLLGGRNGKCDIPVALSAVSETPNKAMLSSNPKKPSRPGFGRRSEPEWGVSPGLSELL